MAFKVLFHFSMIFCVIQLISASDSDLTEKLKEIRSGISRSKNVVREITLDIGRTKQAINSETFNILQQNMGKLYEIERTTGAKVEKNAQEMKKPGKNIAVLQRCVQSAKLSLRGMSVLGLNRLHSCSGSAKNRASALVENLDTALATGKHLMNQLETIESRCSTGNMFKRQNCMTGHLRTVNNALEAYEASSTSKKNGAKKKLEEIISWQNNCSKDYLLKAQETGTKAIVDANKCIQSA